MYHFFRPNAPPASTETDRRTTAVLADYGSGDVLLARSTIYPLLSWHREVGQVSPESLQMAADVLSDALSTSAGDSTAAGDTRARKGLQRFQEHFIARLPQAADSWVSRATILDVCARLGI